MNRKVLIKQALKGSGTKYNIFAGSFENYLNPRWDQKGQTFLFFLKVVLLYIKLKGMEHRTLCKRILCHYTYPRPWDGINIFIFTERSHAAYQIKREWSIEHHASPYSVLTHILDPSVGVKGQTFFLLKEVGLHIKLKGTEHSASCNHIFCPYTHPRPLGFGQKVKKKIFQISHVA